MTVFDRRRFLQAAAFTGAAFSGVGTAMPSLAAVPDRQFRIFMVLGRGEGDNEFGFKDYLARRGLQVQYTIRNTGGDSSKLPAILDQIRAEKPDLIYSWGTPQTLGLVGPYDDTTSSRYIRDIPVVFTYVAAPVDARIVRDLKGSGRNVTGTIHIAPTAVQMNTIMAYRKIKTLGIVYNPKEGNSVANAEELRAETRARGVELVERPVILNADGNPVAASVPQMVEMCADEGVDMLYVGPDTFVASLHRATVAATARRRRLPSFSVTEPIVRVDGGMLALASSGYGIGRFTAFKASQILLDGVAPGAIPVETLKRFSVIINMPVVRELEFYPPIGLLNFAEVIDQ